VVLDQFCSTAQLFSPRSRGTFERKLKWGTVPKVAKFPKFPPPLGAAADPRALGAVHWSLIAALARPFSQHSSLAIRHCPNQPPAKHNRKPVQRNENKQRRSKTTARSLLACGGRAFATMVYQLRA
jgi:hypothetical protein